jgi:hypothetical protein
VNALADGAKVAINVDNDAPLCRVLLIRGVVHTDTVEGAPALVTSPKRSPSAVSGKLRLLGGSLYYLSRKLRTVISITRAGYSLQNIRAGRRTKCIFHVFEPKKDRRTLTRERRQWDTSEELSTFRAKSTASPLLNNGLHKPKVTSCPYSSVG